MQASNDVWQRFILEVLNNGELLNSIGGVFLLIGAYLSDGFMKIVKSLCKKILGKLEEKEPEVKEEEKEVEEAEDKSKHSITPGYSADTVMISTRLVELRQVLECDRISILQFHNGSCFSLSNPMFKLTSTYEALNRGFASASNTLKELLVSNYSDFVSPLLLEHQPINIQGVEEVDLCKRDTDPSKCTLANQAIRIIEYYQYDLAFSAFRFIMEDLGASLFYAILLKTPKEGYPLGILLLQYRDEDDARKHVQEHTCELCAIKHALQTILYKPS